MTDAVGEPAHARTVTERLTLVAPDDDDLPDLHDLLADPAVWEHLPSGRHTHVDETVAVVERARQGWSAHGLDIWVARDRGDDDAGGALVGVGGCSVRGGVAWNLYYRLARSRWGRGFAHELIGASRAAAAQVDPALPVVAYLLEHNTGSRRAAERAGLTLVWRGPDVGPDPAAIRLVYADRPVGDDVVALFAHHR
jgi:RimJ/RimL family protein N-acetyltransferase